MPKHVAITATLDEVADMIHALDWYVRNYYVDEPTEAMLAALKGAHPDFLNDPDDPDDPDDPGGGVPAVV